MSEHKQECEDSSRNKDGNQYMDSEYGDTNKMSFQELLKMHTKQTVWGFKFGEEVMANTKFRDKSIQEKKKDEGEQKEFTLESQDMEDKDEPGPSKITEQKTPHSRTRASVSRSSKRKSTRQNDFVSPQKTRRAPLPLMNWADSKEVWLFMVYKEEASLNLRNPRLFEDFSNFMPRMRAILLDWVMEVCEVYHLRRVTYYLSVDYFDRFLSIRPDVPKNQLQLVGVTCLFLASKLEEIYPPKLTEFSYVCDGACSPEEILACELLILNSLGWDLNIMTPSDWLNLYMQIHFQAPNVTRQKLHIDINKQFLFPQYSGYQFTRASQLLDMFSLDPGFLKFSYSTLAAAAMYFMYGKKAALSASGLTWKQLQPCAEYMAVFYHVIRDSCDPKLISCKGEIAAEEAANRTLANIRFNVKNLVKDENHSLQTHVVNMDYFEKSAIIRLEQMGLKVEKTYVKKRKSQKNDDIEKEDIDDINEKDYVEVCMYDVEKMGCEATSLNEENLNLISSSSDADLVVSDDKAVLTFDEILEGIVKCNKKNIPVQLQTSREMLEEDSDRHQY